MQEPERPTGSDVNEPHRAAKRRADDTDAEQASEQLRGDKVAAADRAKQAEEEKLEDGTELPG